MTSQTDLLRFKLPIAVDLSRPTEIAEFIVRVYDCGCRIEVTFGEGGKVRSYEPCKGHRHLTAAGFRDVCVSASKAEYDEWRATVSYRCANELHYLCKGRRRDGACTCTCHVARVQVSP